MTDNVQQLQKLLAEKEALIAQLQQRNTYLEEQFRLAQQQRFGASSESHPAQGDLFNEAEVELDAVEETIEGDSEQAITVVKQKPVRKKLPADLPRETILSTVSIIRKN